MNTHDIDIELPPLPSGHPTYEFPDGAYDSEQMHQYARAAIEADRKHHQETIEALEKEIESLAFNGSGLLAENKKLKTELKRRGEPVGYIMPTALKQLRAGGHAIVGGVSQGFDVAVYLAPQPAKPVTIYVEALECSECGHVGINDDNRSKSACNSCDWTGHTPNEDRCPGCGRDGTMTAPCPKCGGRYKLRAVKSITLRSAPAPQPAESCASLMSDKTACESQSPFCDSQTAEPVHETARTAGNGAESGMNNGPQGGAHSASSYSVCGCNSDDCRVNGCLSLRQAQSAMAPGGGGMPAEPVKVPSDDQWQTLIGWLDRRRHNPTVQINGKVAGDVADRLHRAENERAAMNEWLEKTEFLQRWVQNGTLPIRHLGRHRADIARDTINQMAITLGKMAAGYRPGDEGWTQEDDEMLRLAMSVEVSDE